MLLAAARDLDLDLRRSVLFGDKASDLLAALAAGIPHRVLLGTDGARGARRRLSRTASPPIASDRSLTPCGRTRCAALLARLPHEQAAA